MAFGPLDESPGIWQSTGELARAAQGSIIQRMGGEDNLLVREVYVRKLDAMRQELAGPEPSPLERLLADRIITCWLHVNHAEAIFAQGEFTLPEADFHQRRISRAHQRYLSAIRTLAQVRKLLGPTVQVNIANQQVNVAG